VLEALPPKPDNAKPEASKTPPENPAAEVPGPSPAIAEPILAEAPVQPGNTNAPQAPASGKISFSSCTVEGSQVALTFDDGPHAANTPRLLDILKQKGVRATFFVVGQNAVEYPEILKRIAAEGHELANHSYSHPVLASLPESGIKEQLDKTHQAVLKATGVPMKLMRPPYGALNNPQRAWVHSHFGYRVVLWDVDPLDWKFRDATRVEQAIVSKAHAGSIILAHDIHRSTIDAVPAILDQLLHKGLQFVTVSELLALDKPAAAKAPPTTAKSDPDAAPARPEAKQKPEKPSVVAKTPAPAAKTARAEKSHPENRPEKRAEKNAPQKAPAAPTQSTAGSGSGGGKKFSQLSEDELKKKWLESLKR
jgi:peptidoglycan/xylan/chitin deacetylase (PgdA/CDA1 family)